MNNHGIRISFPFQSLISARRVVRILKRIRTTRCALQVDCDDRMMPQASDGVPQAQRRGSSLSSSHGDVPDSGKVMLEPTSRTNRTSKSADSLVIKSAVELTTHGNYKASGVSAIVECPGGFNFTRI